jgi:hypothetical protein
MKSGKANTLTFFTRLRWFVPMAPAIIASGQQCKAALAPKYRILSACRTVILSSADADGQSNCLIYFVPRPATDLRDDSEHYSDAGRRY